MLVFPSAALAHATLEHTWPSFRQRVQASPASVRLYFDQFAFLAQLGLVPEPSLA